jgi:hypothetical protein
MVIRIGVSDENSIRLSLDEKINQAKSVLEEAMRTEQYMVFCIKKDEEELKHVGLTHDVTPAEMIHQFSLFLRRITGDNLKELLDEMNENDEYEEEE